MFLHNACFLLRLKSWFRFTDVYSERCEGTKGCLSRLRTVLGVWKVKYLREELTKSKIHAAQDKKKDFFLFKNVGVGDRRQ